MGKYTVKVSKDAKKHLAYHYKSGNKATIKRIERIFKELSENPEFGIGDPEMLKYEYTGLWSRKINQKDRIIYEIQEGSVVVEVISAKGHYKDK